MAKYMKTIMAVLGTVGTIVTTQFPSTVHWLPGLVSAVSSVLVWYAPNVTAAVTK